MFTTLGGQYCIYVFLVYVYAFYSDIFSNRYLMNALAWQQVKVDEILLPVIKQLNAQKVHKIIFGVLSLILVAY